MEVQESKASKYNLSSKENSAETDSIEIKTWVKWRYVMAILFFFAFFNMFSIQSSTSIAVVSMTNVPTTSVEDARIDSEFRYKTNHSNDSYYNTIDTLVPQKALFDWDSQVQGIVLSGYFWGYVIPLVISGVVAEKYGSKNVVLVGGFLASVGTLLGPIAAETNVYLFIASRVICGLGLSVFAPCCHTIVPGWFHRNERGKILAFIYSGFQLGVTATFALTGYLCKEYPTEGWKWSFYISGTSVAVWIVLWFFFAYNTPKENPWISDKEKLYIESGVISSPRKSKVIPWMSIAKSRPLWVIMVCTFGQGWGFFTLLTQLPLYMKTILGFDMSQSGIYASLPFLMMVIVGYVTSIIADVIVKSKIFRMVTVRRIFSLVAILPCGICLLAITFVDSDPIKVYILLVFGMAMFACLHSGSTVNHIDLAPNYSGILQGIINTSASIPGILSPYVAGVVLGSEGGAARWNIVFYISSGMLIGCVLIYTVFAETEVQPWNNTSGSEEPETATHVNDNKMEKVPETLSKAQNSDENCNSI